MSSFLSFGLKTFDLSTVDPIPRRRTAATATKVKPVKKPGSTIASTPATAPEPVATAAEMVALQSELAVLRAELHAIKDAPMIEERRRINARLAFADIAYRNGLK
jgi:hypothetical protein